MTWWVSLRPEQPSASRVVLLVAHAGAGPASLKPLLRFLPPDYAVFALSLPGREMRMDEPPGWEFDHVVREAGTEARDLPQLPVLIAGQCSGAWLAYAFLANDAALRGRCRRLFVVSQAPWHAARTGAALPDDPDAMWARLVASGDVPAEIAADREFRELLEPLFRADYAALAGFPTSATQLTVPIVAMAGRADPYDLELEGWARYTPELRTVWLDCGHLPMQDQPSAVAYELAAAP